MKSFWNPVYGTDTTAAVLHICPSGQARGNLSVGIYRLLTSGVVCRECCWLSRWLSDMDGLAILCKTEQMRKAKNDKK